MGLENKTVNLCETLVIKIETEYLDDLITKVEKERDPKLRAKYQSQLNQEMRRLFPKNKTK